MFNAFIEKYKFFKVHNNWWIFEFYIFIRTKSLSVIDKERPHILADLDQAQSRVQAIG